MMLSRFERRLYAGFIVLILLFTPILVGSFVVISELETNQNDILHKNGQDVIEAERLNSLINEEFALVQAYVLRGHSDIIHELQIVHRNFQSTASNLLLGIEQNESPDLLLETRKLEDESYAAFEGAVKLKESGASIPEIDRYLEQANITRGARVLILVRENVSLQAKQLRDVRNHVNQITKRLVAGLVAACAFAILATCAVIVLLYQMIRSKAVEDRERDERMKLEVELSNARKEAVEVVAHDLKNPLSAMKMSLELLRDEMSATPSLKENEEIEMGFAIATRSINSMQRLIDDQLDHTKIESGQLTIEKTLTNLNELLKDTEVRFRPLMESKNITLAVRFERALFAEVDGARIDQVLSNLLGNALKFTPSGGLVQLIGERAGGHVMLKVKDNGPGISEEARAHIFERYWQVKETSKKGTGLGLSIAKGIVEAHGGQLVCTSEVGHGCEFEVRLKAAELARPAEFTSH